MAATAETVLGVFAHVDTTVRALEDLKSKGYHDLTVYTPVPVHEIEDVLERDRPVSPVRLFTLIGGLTGMASGFFLTIWSAMQWGLITGGKPVASIPPFVVIAFELTILFGGISTVIGMILLGRLPRLRSEEHTSELQSLRHLVCRLLLEKKKTQQTHTHVM